MSQQPFYVIAAKVAGHLSTVIEIADQISMSAKNAKAIASRAGEKAAGFKPITDYIDEMGTRITALVTNINKAALQISRDAVVQMRVNESRTRFRKAMEANPALSKQLDSIYDSMNQELSELAEKLVDARDGMIKLILEIRNQMRAATVVSTLVQVEASHAQEYQGSLNVVADTVDNSAKQIKSVLAECEKMLKLDLALNENL